jgi:hypothetical protein
MAKLKLLPWPKQVRRGKGTFRIEENLPILVGPGSDREVNAAWSLAGEVERRTEVSLSVERMGKLDGIGRRILFLRAGRDETLHRDVAPFAKRLKRAPEAVRDQAYALRVSRHEILAVAASPQGLFYAAQTVRQLVTDKGSVPCVSITDWPTYPCRGVMLDISRFKVPKLESLFDRIERLASLKINVFQLYTEHTFVFRRHPEIGKDCGSMSAEDIIELEDFCRQHFVDLDANLQSFGHHRHLLSIPQYNDLAEIPEEPWTLCPVDKRIYDLLDDLYAECLPAYSSARFNASCDETWELGQGRSARKAARVGVGRVYLDHIKKINRLARKYGKRMMIWADIVLKHPELIPDIPKDIVMLDWSYSADRDLGSLTKLADAGLEHWTCPGVSSWTRIFCDVENACGNIAQRAVAGRDSGAIGLLNTDWGDDGHAQHPATSYHGYAWGAEQSWTPDLQADGRDFDRRFAWAWFGDNSGDFGRLYRVSGRINHGSWRRHPRPFALYWARFPLTDELDELSDAAITRVGDRARQAFALVRKLADRYPEHRHTLREMLFGLGQVFLIEGKIEASRQLAELRAAGEKKLPARLRKLIRELLNEWTTQREEFEDIWMNRNRRSEIAYRLGLYKKRARDYRRRLR